MTEATYESHDHLVIHPYAEKAYLDYAMAVVTDRALGQVEDGEKPVQRRILYAMHDMGLAHTAKPRKCAAMVGEVLGKYHPHGDTSVYDALVRMAQPFTLRYPLIEGQGNFGSRDGDSAAAMRYTEARLSAVADLLLSEIGAGTVDFTPNYDGSHLEPQRLPARLPFLLLNGAMGIAVGMACDLPPHNLREVAAAAIALIDNQYMSTNQLLDIVQGPDFPTGGQLISPRTDILNAYESGRGVLRVRACWKKEELARGQWQLVITEFPYQVSAKRILEEIDTLTNPQPKQGKKVLDQQQSNLKQVSLSLLEKVTDESGRDAAVRLVIVPCSSRQSPEETMAFLFANTSLEESVSVNNTAIGLDGKPSTKGFKTLLSEWVTYRTATVRRRTQYELDVVTRRSHILEGRMLVYLKVEAVIATIREAEEPRVALMTTFSLTEVQADDILEMRLRQLARLDGFKFEKELAECRAEQARLTVLLASVVALNMLIVKEISADALKYGDERRTLIKAEARATALPAARAVPDEPVTLILSTNLWIRARSGHDVDEASLSYKAGDTCMAVVKTRTTQPVLFMDSLGRVYSLQASDIPAGRGDGVPLTSLIDVQAGAKIAFCLADVPERLYLFSGQNGFGFLAPVKALASRSRSGKAFLKLDTGESPLPPVAVSTDGGGYVLCASSDGKALAFPLNEVKLLEKGGKGVTLMGLGADQLTALFFCPNAEFEGMALAGDSKVTIRLVGAEWSRYLLHRARRGVFLPKKAVLQY